jgi:deoxycytidine triphosphate deaminase
MSTEPVSARPLRFANTEDEAEERFEATRGSDPFPGIAPALLNSADLLDYVAATGMIFPFSVPDKPEELLKPASCAIRLGGEVVYWDTDAVSDPDSDEDSKPTKVKRVLKPGEELILRRNSIVYVTLEPTLRMPDYIAARFNLTIRDIYRGILVGTGPLVDPGFSGRLSLPLHNLTYNDYTIEGGEPLVWMEFTKISPNDRWNDGGRVSQRAGEYVEFPSHKNKRGTVDDYLKHAYSSSITSSIPRLVTRAKAAAVAAEKSVRRQQRIFGGASVVGALVVVIAIAAMFVATVTVINDDNNSRSSISQEVNSLNHQVHELRKLVGIERRVHQAEAASRNNSR